MSDEEEPSAADPRPASCKADFTSYQFATCERCAVAWDPMRGAGPACAPVTPRKLLAVLERIASRHEASFEAILSIFRDDQRAADPLAALTLLLETRALARLLERVLTNKEVLALLRKEANG